MLYTDSGSPIPNDKPMEQFKASDQDWKGILRAAETSCNFQSRTILELRDRVEKLEAAPDRVLVRNQTGEYLRAGTPVYLAAPAKAVPSDEELWEVQLKVKSQSRPHIGWQVWSPESEPLIAAHRALYDHGYEQGLAAGRAEQPATTEPPTDPEPGDFQTLHGIALDMVDSLRPIVIPEILNVLRRAIREPMAEQQAAADATPEPEPEPVHSQYFSGHGLIAGEIDRALAEGGWTPTPEPTPEPEPSPSPAAGLVEVVVKALQEPCPGWDGASRDVIRAVARWLRKKRYYLAAALLEPEANR